MREVLTSRIRRQMGKGARAVATVSASQAGKAASTVGRLSRLRPWQKGINGRHRGRVVDTHGLSLMVMKPNSLRCSQLGNIEERSRW